MSEEVESFLADLDPGVRELATTLRAEIRSLLPDAVERAGELAEAG